MLAGTSRARDEVVGRLRPTAFREFWEFTVEKVAVNAVMAGARPEYLPVILAALASGMTGRSSSTTSFATIAMVNGPIRNEIGMNSGIGAFGPYSHANATIGRAYSMGSANLQGGSVPGETYMGSQGNSYAYSAAFAENEERSPWTPFHVQHGFEPTDSTVSLFLGGWYTQFGTIRDDTWQERFRGQLAACDPFIGPIVALDPLRANKLVEYGFDTREKLVDWLAENSLRPAREYWDNQWMQTLVRPWAVLGQEPYATHLKADPDEPVQMFRPQDISVVVVGGETGGTYKMLAGSLRDSIAKSTTGAERPRRGARPRRGNRGAPAQRLVVCALTWSSAIRWPPSLRCTVAARSGASPAALAPARRPTGATSTSPRLRSIARTTASATASATPSRRPAGAWRPCRGTCRRRGRSRGRSR